MSATESARAADPSPSAAGPAAAHPPPTSRAAIDAALDDLVRMKDGWARLPVRDRIAILRELRRDVARVAERWAEAAIAAEKIPPGTPTAGEEWLVGPYFVLRNVRLLEEALEGIADQGRPRLPHEPETRPDGRLAVRVFPGDLYDRLFYPGVEASVWMEAGVGRDELPKHQAMAYAERDREGAVTLVLGGGNVTSIGPMDALYKLFVDLEVVVYKAHPVNAYLGPIFAEAFQALVDWGVLRIVYGGAEEGEYLCRHEAVDTIHITGSDKTVEAIVFGPGDEGEQRKRERRPRLEKPITSELGNVSPVIVVPGPWSESDVAFQAENLAGMLVNNAGFNCNASRVIVTRRGWRGREPLMGALERQLAAVPPRHAYYPGAEERYQRFVTRHPEARKIGTSEPGELPWVLIRDVDAASGGDLVFGTEAFTGVCAETALGAASTAEYLRAAVQLANERIWGTLNVTLLVHPETLKDPEVDAAFEQAIADLRYGTVAINIWAAAGFGLVVTPWGAYPGHDLYDIQSGTGVVHNTLMLESTEKTVIRAPFRARPKPPWFPTHKTALPLARKLAEFEAAPSPAKLPGIFFDALRG